MNKYLYLLLAFFLSQNLIGQQTYLHCGSLVNTESGKIEKEITVIVDKNEIISVEKGYINPPEGAYLYNLKNHTVMPGLMDMHVHIESQLSPKAYENRFRMNKADVALQATTYCKKTLEAGFTTVRDLGGTGVNVSLQTAINRGFVDGPRIYTAEKSIATTGGHADPTNGVRDDLKGDPGPSEGVVNSPEEARKAVRQRYKNGADVIKITATGGVLSVAKDGSGPQFTMEELEGIISTAKDYGMTTAAHAHGKAGMERAIKAGITSIEHGTMMDDETIDLMKEYGTYYVPTISAGMFVAEMAKKEGYFPAVIVPKALSIGPQIQNTFAKAYKNGVKIAFGTDSGVSPHGDNAQEIQFMVEAGMPFVEVIISATKTPSEMLGITKLGSVSKGMWADIVAVEGDPSDDVTKMMKMSFVMKNGVVYKKP